MTSAMAWFLVFTINLRPVNAPMVFDTEAVCAETAQHMESQYLAQFQNKLHLPHIHWTCVQMIKGSWR